jgi:hypothetical protein
MAAPAATKGAPVVGGPSRGGQTTKIRALVDTNGISRLVRRLRRCPATILDPYDGLGESSGRQSPERIICAHGLHMVIQGIVRAPNGRK